MTDTPITVSELMSSIEWPSILRRLTFLLDHDGIGGVTTEQIEDYIARHPALVEELRKA